MLSAASAEGASSSKVRRHVERVDGEYFVVLADRNPKATAALAHSLAKSYGGEVLAIYPFALKGFLLKTTDARAVKLADDPRVVLVEENYVIYNYDPASQLSSGRSRGALPGEDWHLDRIDQRQLPLDGRYQRCTSGSGVYAYVLDTGVHAAHPEFGGRVVLGRDFVQPGSGNDLDPCPTVVHGAWHGTAVASVLGGNGVGVAPGVNLVSLRTFDCNGDGTADYVINALNWILSASDPDIWALNPRYHGFQPNPYRWEPGVINMSFWKCLLDRSEEGGGQGGDSVEIAVFDVYQAGFTVVTAANNYNRNACDFAPANLGFRGPGGGAIDAWTYRQIPASVITVGGTDIVQDASGNYVDVRWDTGIGGGRDSGSNAGPCVTSWAPAAEIRSARHRGYDQSNPNAYEIASGTSFASPIIAGLVARHLQTNRYASPDQIWQWLDSTATKFRMDGTTALVANTTAPAHNYALYREADSCGACPTNSGFCYLHFGETQTPTHSTLGPVGLAWMNDAPGGSCP